MRCEKAAVEKTVAQKVEDYLVELTVAFRKLFYKPYMSYTTLQH